MKNVLVSIMLLGMMQPVEEIKISKKDNPPQSQNIFIITIDGFRWQEMFTGADSILINEEKYTEQSDLLKAQYWASTIEERRKKLLPFMWTVVEKQGQLYGNRNYDNRVNVANAYAISYPGYNEILTGNTDPFISSNKKQGNPNINVLEYLNSKDEFKDKVAAFTSWDVFPYILNTERNGLVVNSGYSESINQTSREEQLLNKVQKSVVDKQATRYDQLTFLNAKEYIKQKHPKVLFLGLGETDESAHAGRYDLYLQNANAVDRMIAELWHWVQTTEGYKNNTTFIITTDHGRGMKTNRWTSHGAFIKGSSQAWLAVIGPGIQPLGEMKEDQQLYHKQLAQTIAHIVGEEFEANQPIANAVDLPTNKKTPTLGSGPASFVSVVDK